MGGRRPKNVPVKMTKSVLDRAKAFLCWDVFPGLSVQLVEVQEAVSYYYPPGAGSAIILFYDSGLTDFSKPLFNLFHEAGHHARYLQMKDDAKEDAFMKVLDTSSGPERAAFEKQAWEEGRRFLIRFIGKEGLDPSLARAYDDHARRSIATYEDDSTGVRGTE